MPNSRRKLKLSSGVSRLVSNIRSKRADASPFVVESGFPTSLADIVVRNRSRRSKSKRQDTTPDSFGCKVSEIISAVQLGRGEYVASDEVAVTEEAQICRLEEGEEGEEEEGAVHAPSASGGEEGEVVGEGGGQRALGIGAKLCIAVMILAACWVSGSRGIVLGIMIVTIALLLLDAAANRLFGLGRTSGKEEAGM